MRFKSILGALIFICFASFLALVVFVQTQNFGRIATKVISSLSQKRAQAQVSIKSIGISLFPLGIELNQVKINKNMTADKKIRCEFGKLGFYVGVIEFEDKKFTLGEVRISDSTIDYTGPDNDEKEIEKIDQEVIKKIFNYTKELPVRVDAVLLENSKIFINYELFEAKRLKLLKRKDAFLVRFHLANLRPVKDKDFFVDEVWGDAEVGRNVINIHRLKIQHDVHSFLIKGKIHNYPLLKNAEASFSGESNLYINNLKHEIQLPPMIKVNDGFAHLSFKGQLKNKSLDGALDISISDLNSNIITAKQVIAGLELKNSILKINKLKVENLKESLNLLSSSEVLDLKSMKYLYQPLSVKLEEFELSNALSILPSLKVLKGSLTGEMVFKYQNRDMEFKPKDGFVIKNLGLVVGENNFTVLMIKRAKLTTASFRVANLVEFQMDSMIELNHSLLDLHGKVNSKVVDFTANDTIVDLEDFGNIANLDIKGKGHLNLEVSGPIDDVNINLRGKTKGFEVLGYKLGDAEKDLTIALGKSSVFIHKLESIYRSTPVSGAGSINYGNLDISLGINSFNANFHDLKEILNPIFSKLPFLPEDFDLSAKITAQISGKTNMDHLKIRSDVKFTDMLAYGENISSGDFVIALENRKISLKQLTANKGKGQVKGDFEFNLQNDQLTMDYAWDKISLSSLALTKKTKLNLQGMISGSLQGQGTTKDYILKMKSKIYETQAQDYKFSDSIFDLEISPLYVAGKVYILGSIVKSEFDYSLNKSKQSMLRMDIEALDLKPLATAFLGQHLESEEFNGSLKFKLDSHFQGSFQQVSLKANLESLVFQNESFNVNYKSTQPQFLIENNYIKKWNLSISEPDLYVRTKGNGRFGEEVDLINEVHFNSKLFEVLLSQVLSSEGFIRNIFKIYGSKDKYQISASSRSSDLNLTLGSIPFPLNHLSYAIEYSGNRLLVQELKTTLENGSVALKGDVFFDDENPDINLKYSLDKAEIPILGKSVLNLSGDGAVLGNEPPYNLGGEILINKGQIVNELNDFSPKSNVLSQVRFLPASQESPIGKLINLNLNIKAENPIRITNSLMDVSLKGEVTLSGNPFRPKGEGRLFSPSGTSRVFFKNSEYFITNADLNFSPKKEISNPDFDVQALTYIANYKVYAKAYGDLERFNFDLTSDPALPRNSILSLIAFGYTDEIQNTLEQRDQQNLTQVGVGSFVFDRFKISDILNKQFGLQVNLGTVLEQSQTDSLLSGRAQDGQGQLGRTRSATKIELKKRLDEALTLSVSSTMGGSIGQRQSMNLNYSVSKKVQLEGVYELRSNAEGEEDILINNSIGGDLKFRWTFK